MVWISSLSNYADFLLTTTSLNSIAKRCGVGLLYHAVFESVPAALGDTLHNVTPDQLYDHLKRLKQHFEIVNVDEFIKFPDYSRHAFVTFDDGYKTVIQSALPVLESLSIPATIYINGKTFDNKILWRDKIRFIIENDLVEEFLVGTDSIAVDNSKPFYRYSKDARNNSQQIDQALDLFFEKNEINSSQTNFCFDDASWFIEHPLLSYGNHCHAHYVMSSLSKHEQKLEINLTKDLLARHVDIGQSRLLSIPFGDDGDFNEYTIRAADELGYSGVLLSRGKINIKHSNQYGVSAVERFMPKGDDIDATVAKAYSKSI